jgi:UDP-glucuronate decarboxylase
MIHSIVAGGSGFIGSHLCKKLLESGEIVTCIDSLITSKKDNIAQLLKDYPNNFSFLKADINFGNHLENLINFMKAKHASTMPNRVYNLACPASPKAYQSDPIHTFMTNTLGTLNLLKCAEKYNMRFLLASTSEVYGNPNVHPQKEEYRGDVNFIGPRACYDVGKRGAECLTFDYKRKNTDMSVRVARIFNTYGPNMDPDDGRVVSNFIMQALKNENITVYGDGTQTRSLCYVSDTVEGLVKLMNHPEFSGPVNLGNTHEMKIIDIAKKIIELTKSTSKITFKELPQDDPLVRCPDIALAKSNLSWSPAISVDSGLLKTIEHFKSIV